MNQVPSGHQVHSGHHELFYVEPEKLTIVGLDTKHGPKHPLYDPRCEEKPDLHFVDSIRRSGVKKPILVRKVGEQLQVVDGRRRVINARRANEYQEMHKLEKLTVPVKLEEGTDQEVFEAMVLANCFTKQPSPIESAHLLERYLGFEGTSEDDAAKVFGVTLKTISNWKAMLDLAAPVQKAVKRKEISSTAAAKLAQLPKREQNATLKEIRSTGAATVATVAKAAGTNNLAFKAPSKKLVKKLTGVDDAAWSAFVQGARWAIGDLPAEKIKGLKKLLKALDKNSSVR